MAARINIGDIGNFAEDQFEKLLRTTVFETDRRLKEESPVDTGRFRLSWAISENGTPGYDAGFNPGSTQVAPPRRLDYQVERLGKVYHIHNSLPYAYRLAYEGWSKQAPDPGWTDRIAKEMADWAKAEADRVGRSA